MNHDIVIQILVLISHGENNAKRKLATTTSNFDDRKFFIGHYEVTYIRR